MTLGYRPHCLGFFNAFSPTVKGLDTITQRVGFSGRVARPHRFLVLAAHGGGLALRSLRNQPGRGIVVASRRVFTRSGPTTARNAAAYRPEVGTFGASCGSGSGSARTGAAGAGKPSTSRAAGMAASAMAAWPSAVG